MPTRRILRPWTTQPPLQYGLRARYRDRLAWSWSATREFSDSDGRLQAYSQPRGGIYYASQRGRAGMCVSGSNTTINTTIATSNVPQSPSSPVSFAIFCDLAIVSAAMKVLWSIDSNIASLRAGNGSAEKIAFLTREVGDSVLQLRIEEGATYTSGPTAIAFTAVPRSHYSLWRDGREIGSVAMAGNWVASNTSSNALYSWAGLYGSALWSRELSPAELRDITASYWGELYEPQAIYVPRSSGAPAYTHPTLSNARMIWTGPGAGKPAIDYSW